VIKPDPVAISQGRLGPGNIPYDFGTGGDMAFYDASEGDRQIDVKIDGRARVDRGVADYECA